MTKAELQFAVTAAYEQGIRDERNGIRRNYIELSEPCPASVAEHAKATVFTPMLLEF